ncbi:MAG: cation:proton antiporter subunit C [Patescibacteria group bacterium]|nr:cation:proton antiporter subunit C [Patescibacteria group bacterium]
MISIIFLTTIFLIVIGISGVFFQKNFIKIIIAINIISDGVNLFLVSLGYRQGGVAPIFTNALSLDMVSPTPQALILTSIVINLAITALLLSLSVLISSSKNSINSDK